MDKPKVEIEGPMSADDDESAAAICSTSASPSPLHASPHSRQCRGGGVRKVGAMFRKNVLLKWRNRWQTSIEILSPLLLVSTLVIGWSLSDTTYYPARIYANETVINDRNAEILTGIVTEALQNFQVGFDINGDFCVRPFDNITNFQNFTNNLNVTTLTNSSIINSLNISALEVCFNFTLPDLTQFIDVLDYHGPLPIPSFDMFVGLHKLLVSFLGNDTLNDPRISLINQFAQGSLGNLLTLGKLYFAPANPDLYDSVAGLVHHMNETTTFFNETFGQIFNTTEEGISFILQNAGAGSTWAFIVLRSDKEGDIDYDIRMNYSTVPSTRLIVNPLAKGVDSTYRGYYTSGFLTLQRMISAYLMNVSSPYSNPVGAVFPTREYSDNIFYLAVGSLVGFIMSLSILYPSSRLIKCLVEEKENKIKETLKMMGLSDFISDLSWGLFYLILFAIISLGFVILVHFTFLSASSVFLLFFAVMLFFLSVIALCFLVASFFSRAKIAGIFGPIILFSGVLPRYIFFGTFSTERVYSKILASLLSPTAFTFGADKIAEFEGAGLGVSFTSANAGEYSFSLSLIMLTFDTALYFLLAWYFQEVLPRGNGVPRKPWFLFTPSFWIPKKQSSQSFVSFESETGEGVEAIDPSFACKSAIHIQKLRKVFGKNVAVNDLTLTMYEDQITCLLGHNGAGKSTTISMLTGLLPLSGGDCNILGWSVSDDMSEIRKFIGICPQENVIFPKLTVAEHLDLVSVLKDVPSSDILSQRNYILEQVGLSEKKKVFAQSLSGGMKRKLCLAMALIGGSKVIFLDEPTSGMDPYSRRATWDLLRQIKTGRVIVLTTHFMDEADLLGDRVAVMSNGKLQCVGSSLFLKSHYGLGYSFTLTKDSAICDSAKVSELIASHVPEMKVGNSTAGEMLYHLPLSSVGQFAALFNDIEMKKSALGIGSYGISMTTLEQVFMRLAADQKSEGNAETEEMEEEQEVSKEADSDVYDDGKVCTDSFTPLIQQWDVKYHLAGPLVQFMQMLRKRFWSAKRDLKSFFFQILLPVVAVALVLLILTVNIDPSGTSLTLDSTLFSNGNGIVDLTYANNSVGSSFVDAIANSSTADLIPVVAGGANNSVDLSQFLLDEILIHTNPRYAALAFDDSIYEQFSIPGIRTGIPSALTILHNSTSPHSLPAIFSEVQRVLYFFDLQRRGFVVSDVSHTVHNYPLPLTGLESQTNQTILSLIASLFILIPISFITANFIVFIVKERAVKSKHLQLTSGVNIFSFWLAHYLFDLFMYTLVVIAVMIVFFAYQNRAFVGTTSKVFATLLLFMFYGISTLPLSYCLSFLFSQPTAAQISIAGLNFFLGFVLLLASFILDSLQSTQDVNKVLKNFYRLVPPFNFGEGIITMSSADLRAFILGTSSSPFDWDIAGRSIFWMAAEAVFFFALTMFIERGLFGLIAAYVRKALNRRKNALTDITSDRGQNEDEDVRQERERICRHGSIVSDLVADFSSEGSFELQNEENDIVDLEVGRPAEDVVVIQKLRKVFPSGDNTPPKVAVNSICLGIPRGECFGFLGVNGAGKTTTLSILTHDINPTSGDAYVDGYSVSTQFSKVREHVGYCPQFDPLLGNMTAREHLIMFGRLKGIPSRIIDEAVAQLLQHAGLTRYADVPAKAYSGGNKRKLALAIALIGSPDVVFLDEPSSGMDPVARRSMWTAIQFAASTKSVVLTTHSMEECEALCGRVGILVNGSFQVLGSVQHLKSRFGGGYQVEVSLSNSENLSKVEDFFSESFLNATVMESHAGLLKFELQKQLNISLANLFEIMESNKESLKINEYSISQPTLEQIFIDIARQQEEDSR